MTNGEKLEQIFPNGICPFSKGWLSAKYREPKPCPREEYISLPQLKQTICNITAEYDTETIHLDRLMNEIDNFPTISLENAIPIPEGATNANAFKAMFPSIDASVSGNGDVVDVYNLGIYCQTFDTEWWNAPYRVESEIEKNENI